MIQVLPGGVVPRRRAVDGTPLGLLRPFETRSFTYSLNATGLARRVSVRLLFRNVAPYFVRGLAAEQPQDVPGLGALVENIEIVEMATASVNVPGN